MAQEEKQLLLKDQEDEIHQLHAISLIEDIKDWANKDGMHSLCIERCILWYSVRFLGRRSTKIIKRTIKEDLIMNLEDYKIVIQFDKNEELYWDVYKKGEPHFIGNNISELVFIRTACEEVIEHIKRLQHEANKHL